MIGFLRDQEHANLAGDAIAEALAITDVIDSTDGTAPFFTTILFPPIAGMVDMVSNAPDNQVDLALARVLWQRLRKRVGTLPEGHRAGPMEIEDVELALNLVNHLEHRQVDEHHVEVNEAINAGTLGALFAQGAEPPVKAAEIDCSAPMNFDPDVDDLPQSCAVTFPGLPGALMVERDKMGVRYDPAVDAVAYNAARGATVPIQRAMLAGGLIGWYGWLCLPAWFDERGDFKMISEEIVVVA
jgi:hypothetical protein